MLERVTRLALDRPKTVIAGTLLVTVLFALQFPKITIDTDPENMLEPDQAERVLYEHIKEAFGRHDLIVVGIVDEKGIFRIEALGSTRPTRPSPLLSRRWPSFLPA